MSKNQQQATPAQTVFTDSSAAVSLQLEHADAAAIHAAEPACELSPPSAAAGSGQGAVSGSHPPAPSSPLTTHPDAAALPSGQAAPPLLPPAPSPPADAPSSSPAQRGSFLSSSFSSSFAQTQLAELAAAAAPSSSQMPSVLASHAPASSVASAAALSAAQLCSAVDGKLASAAAANAATAAMSPPLVQAVSSAVGTAHVNAAAIKMPSPPAATVSLPAAAVAFRPAEISMSVKGQQASVPAAYLSHDTLMTDTAALASQTLSAERISKNVSAVKQASVTDAKLFAEKWEIEAQSAMSSRVASASSQSLSVAAELSDGSTAGLLHDAQAASRKVSILSTSCWIRTSACSALPVQP